MSTREQILALLQGPEASRIRFTFPTASGTVTIGPGTFHHVAHAIRSNQLRVQVSSTLPAGVGAMYFAAARPSNNPPIPQANTILTPQVLGRELGGRALHECLHAAYDLLRTGITALDDEASAYVVQTLFYRMSGLTQPRWNSTIRSIAVDVANKLLQQYARGTRGIPAVDTQAWAALRLVVLTSPIYMFPNSPANWTPGVVATGGSYTHDG
jgi:hypothetical protein